MPNHLTINNKYNPIKKTIINHIKKHGVKVKDKRKDKSIDLLTDILDKFSLDKPITRTINIPKILLQDFSTDNMQLVPYNKPKTIEELYMDMIMNCLDKIIITDKKLKIKGKNGIKETRTTI